MHACGFASWCTALGAIPLTDSSNAVGLVEKTLIYLYSMHTEGSPPPVLVMINDKMSTVIN